MVLLAGGCSKMECLSATSLILKTILNDDSSAGSFRAADAFNKLK